MVSVCRCTGPPVRMTFPSGPFFPPMTVPGTVPCSVFFPVPRYAGAVPPPGRFPVACKWSYSSGHVHLLRHYPGISLPDMTPVSFPEKNNLRSYSFWQPLKRLTIRGEYFSSGILPVETYSSTAVRSDVEARYRLTNKFSLYMSTNYLSDRYRTPRSLYTRGTSAGVAYQLSDRFLLKAGASYQYNTVLRKWEWIYMTGLVFCF